MRISPKYADRTDIGRLTKWWFTIEDRIERSTFARMLYKQLFHGPLRRVTDVTFAICLVPGIMLLLVFESLMSVDETDGEIGEGAAVIAAVLVVVLCVFFLPAVGWSIVGMTALAMVGLWFAGVMRDYAQQLSIAGHR